MLLNQNLFRPVVESDHPNFLTKEMLERTKIHLEIKAADCPVSSATMLTRVLHKLNRMTEAEIAVTGGEHTYEDLCYGFQTNPTVIRSWASNMGIEVNVATPERKTYDRQEDYDEEDDREIYYWSKAEHTALVERLNILENAHQISQKNVAQVYNNQVQYANAYSQWKTEFDQQVAEHLQWIQEVRSGVDKAQDDLAKLRAELIAYRQQYTPQVLAELVEQSFALEGKSIHVQQLASEIEEAGKRIAEEATENLQLEEESAEQADAQLPPSEVWAMRQQAKEEDTNIEF